MKFIHIICLSLALSASSLSATVSAQTGTGYFLHTVTKGQSLYSIASMYHISVDDIVRLNPGSKEQIRAGQALKIPQAQYSNEDGKQFHTIQAGETLYQLTLKYHVTAQAICKANPGLSAENFRIGQVIVIPAQDNAPAQTEQTAQAEPAVKKNEWRDAQGSPKGNDFQHQPAVWHHTRRTYCSQSGIKERKAEERKLPFHSLP